MFSDKCDLRGKSGIRRLEEFGPYVVITNKLLYDRRQSTRFAIVNEREEWVDSVYRDPNEAAAAAKELSRG